MKACICPPSRRVRHLRRHRDATKFSRTQDGSEQSSSDLWAPPTAPATLRPENTPRDSRGSPGTPQPRLRLRAHCTPICICHTHHTPKPPISQRRDETPKQAQRDGSPRKVYTANSKKSFHSATACQQHHAGADCPDENTHDTATQMTSRRIRLARCQPAIEPHSGRQRVISTSARTRTKTTMSRTSRYEVKAVDQLPTNHREPEQKPAFKRRQATRQMRTPQAASGCYGKFDVPDSLACTFPAHTR